MKWMCVSSCALVCLMSIGAASIAAQVVQPASQPSSPAALVKRLNDVLKNHCPAKPTLTLAAGGILVSQDGDGTTSTLKLTDIIGVGGMSAGDGATVTLSCRDKAPCVERVQKGAKTSESGLSFTIVPEDEGRPTARLFGELLGAANGRAKK